MLGLHVFRQTGPPRWVGCFGPTICLPHKDGGIPLNALLALLSFKFLEQSPWFTYDVHLIYFLNIPRSL